MSNLHEEIGVLLISPLPPPAGGIATWTVKYKDWLDQKNISVKILNNAVGGKRAKVDNKRINMIDELKRSIGISRNLKRALKSFSPNIVHINSSCGKFGIIRDYLCVKYSLKKKKTVVVHYHCNLEDQISNVIQKYFFKKMSLLAHKIIVMNQESLNYANLLTNKKAIKLPNFIEHESILLNNKKINNSIKNIIFIGHVNNRKGIREILEVANEKKDIQFSIVGPITNEIQINEHSSNVKFLGALDHVDIINKLDEADLFLFPTYSEGFSIALLEAMARGLPIITTDVGANKEMIEEYGGLLVKVSNSSEIERGIDNLVSAETREKMSKWNIEKVKKDYSRDIILSRLITYYSDLLKDSLKT